MIDLIIQSGTKFALHQWLDARGLGENVQDTDPESPTFGEYTYTHNVGQLHYWNHPNGVLIKSIDTTDPENPITDTFPGFYARLSLSEIPDALQTWVDTSTATSILESFNGVGGEGITILNPEDVYAYLNANNLPKWGGLLGVGNQWSDPALWAFSNVMTGDQREFDGPTQYPQGWREVAVAPTNEWQPNTSYTVGDEVTYQGTTYSCLQAHTSLVGWEPDATPALWSVL